MTVDQNSKVSAAATHKGVGKTTAAEPNRVAPKPLDVKVGAEGVCCRSRLTRLRR